MELSLGRWGRETALAGDNGGQFLETKGGGETKKSKNMRGKRKEKVRLVRGATPWGKGFAPLGSLRVTSAGQATPTVL